MNTAHDRSPDDGPASRSLASGLLFAGLAFLVGVAITLWLWQVERTEEEHRTRARFDVRVGEVTAAIVARMSAYEQVLRGGASLVATLGGVTRAQWRDYVAGLDLARNYSGFQGVGYAEYVREADKETYVRRLRTQDLPEFDIRPPGDRPAYAPVTYLEPNTERNLRAHGFDMLSEPTRNTAMLEAQETGKPAITGRLKLVSESQQSPASGFLMYVPVYRPGMPIETPEQRWAALLGFVNSPYRVNDLIRGILGDRDDHVDLEIFDGVQTQPENLIYDEDGVVRTFNADLRGAHTAKSQIAIENRVWTLNFSTQPEFDRAGVSAAARITLTAGLGISALLAGIVWLVALRLAQTHEAQARFEQLAKFDPLTGLPNRSMFQYQLDKAIAQATRDRTRVALLFVDLDSFKFINDTEGHATGDALLMAAATRLETTARRTDVVSRFGGDEFTLILNGIRTMDEVSALAERVVDTMGRPYELNGREFTVTSSAGIAIFPEDGTDAATLLMHADNAMYSAKERGKRNFQFYSQAMATNATRHLLVEARLRHALQENELYLVYQPVVRLADGRLAGVEALLRLRQDDAEAISTGALITVAEQCGLIGVIGDFVIDAACRQLVEWTGAKAHGIKLAINISARQFRQKDMVHGIRSAIEATGADPSLLELELTETAFIADVGEAEPIMQELRRIGLSIVLDDFGTGYSSLGYLKRFPIDKIKIDRSFVHDLAPDIENSAIVKAIIAMGESLQVAVVAEGVETARQAELMREYGCPLAQGHYFGPPCSADELMQRYGTLLLDPASATVA